MSDNLPRTRDADDATHDDAPPTDAVSDEVKTAAADADSNAVSPGAADVEAAKDAAAATDEAEHSEADIPGIPDTVGTEERLPGTDASAPADAS
ncbi:hypothetical protein [Microbacterium sp. cx-59]|uniref:hypothetical protein n=1 Tax=Microbacterium sp. cx-59 TaxID=2891207 RepID=UPI001E3031BF|nr:hypothetical protein [Microbacterium sp. cx-59]MCC4909070.1 hypothetical protein [Microbacterium sp. cx-59]